MRRFLIAAVAALTLLAVAVPASAAEVSNRAYIVGQLGDSLVELSGLTDAEVNAILAGAPDPGWDDDEGDFDGDGDEDARDERVRKYAWILHAIGVLEGTTASTFDPHDPLDRDATASVFKRIIFGPGTENRSTQYSDVGAVNTHSCNIHLISDIDQDDVYGDAPFIIQGYPPVPSLYKPHTSVTEPQVDNMVDRLAAYISTAADPFQRRNCGEDQPPAPVDLDVRLEATVE